VVGATEVEVEVEVELEVELEVVLVELLVVKVAALASEHGTQAMKQDVVCLA
jgi:hypothetical protein